MKIIITILAILLLGTTTVTAQDSFQMKEWRQELGNKLDGIKAAEKANMPPADIAQLWMEHGDQWYFMGVTGNLVNSRRSYNKALQIYDEGAFPHDVTYANILLSISKTYVVFNKKKARTYLDRAATILKNELDEEHSAFQTIAEFYALIDGKQTKTKQLEDLESAPTTFNVDKPVIIYQPNMRFPREAYKTGYGATVVVKFNVEADGLASDIEVVSVKLGKGGTRLKSTPRGAVMRAYRKEAKISIKNYKFKPASIDGEYVRTEGEEKSLTWRFGK